MEVFCPGDQVAVLTSGAHQVDVNVACKACTQTCWCLRNSSSSKNKAALPQCRKLGISMYKCFQSDFFFFLCVWRGTQLPSGLKTEVD